MLRQSKTSRNPQTSKLEYTMGWKKCLTQKFNQASSRVVFLHLWSVKNWRRRLFRTSRNSEIYQEAAKSRFKLTMMTTSLQTTKKDWTDFPSWVHLRKLLTQFLFLKRESEVLTIKPIRVRSWRFQTKEIVMFPLWIRCRGTLCSVSLPWIRMWIRSSNSWVVRVRWATVGTGARALTRAPGTCSCLLQEWRKTSRVWMCFVISG